MKNTQKRYDPAFKRQVVKMALKEEMQISDINKMYGLGKGTVKNWIRQFEKECEKNPVEKELLSAYANIRSLRRELLCLKKENTFLKKAIAFFQKETD